MVWDTTEDAEEFVVTLIEYANNRWGAADERLSGQPIWRGREGTVVVMQAGDRSLWIIAPTDALAEMILLELQ